MLNFCSASTQATSFNVRNLNMMMRFADNNQNTESTGGTISGNHLSRKGELFKIPSVLVHVGSQVLLMCLLLYIKGRNAV